MLRAAATLAAGALLAAAGCGGDDDEQQIRRAMRELVAALNAHDGKKFCDELVTQEFLETQTFANGDRAHDECKRLLGQIRGLRLKLVRIASVKVNDDRARVKAVLSFQGQEQDQLYRLQRESGDWRFASGPGG